jgi:hypothetical protein
MINNPRKPLQGKRALVTGGAVGIGERSSWRRTVRA